MSLRTSVPADGAWHQVGTAPATVQLITVGTAVMVASQTLAPTGADGMILVNQGDNHTFQAATAIWVQVISTTAAVVAVQPE